MHFNKLNVTTEIWRKGLLNKSIRDKYQQFYEKWYPKEINIPKKIIKINQICDPFTNKTNTSPREVVNIKTRLAAVANDIKVSSLRTKHEIEAIFV